MEHLENTVWQKEQDKYQNPAILRNCCSYLRLCASLRAHSELNVKLWLAIGN